MLSVNSVVKFLPREFYSRPTLTVARELLGARLVRVLDGQRLSGFITEAEAYIGEEDLGCHAKAGLTPRTAVMYGPPGHAYVYFTYGMHWCLNVVTGPEGTATAVLLRSGTVVEGLEVARTRRPASRTDSSLASGPARLAQALGVDGSYLGVDLLDPTSQLRLVPPAGKHVGAVLAGPRVGLSAAANLPWRFWLDGEPSVSRYRPATPRRGRPQSAP